MSNTALPPSLRKRGPRPPSFGLDKANAEVVDQKLGPRLPSGDFKAAVKPAKRERRASDLLRGQGSSVEVEALLHDEEYKELAEEKPTNFGERIELMYKKKIHERRVVPRCLLCILAVCLLWGSSLAVCRLLVSVFVPSPTFEQMENSVLDLNATVITQRDGYKGCVNEKYSICLDNYVRTRDEEVARWTLLENVNFLQLSIYSAIVDHCATDHDKLMSALNTTLHVDISPSNKGLLILTDYALNPTEYEFGIEVPIDCSPIEDISSQQLSAREAINIAVRTADASNSAVNNLTSQLDARIAYDLAYLGVDLPNYWELKTAGFRTDLFDADALFAGMNGTLEDLQRCLLGETVNAEQCPNATALMALVNSTYGAFGADFGSLQARALLYKNEYLEIAAKAEAIANVADQVASVVDVGLFSIPPPWDFDSLSVGFGSFDSNFFSADILGSIGIDPDVLAEIQDQATQEFLESVAGSAEELEALKEEMAALDAEFADGLLNDYDPPPVDYNETNADHYKNAEDLAGKMSEDLNYVQNSTPDAQRLEDIVSSANETAANLLQGVADRTVDLFSYPDYVFKAFQVGLGDLANLLVTFDTVYRVMHSVLLIRKYWGISGINTPPADVKADGGFLYKEKKSIPQLIAMVLTHPLLQLINTAVWITLITLVIFLAYQPLYTEYINGCVKHNYLEIPTEDDGTMIFRNVFTISTNYALSEGDKAVTKNIDALNLERQLSCNEYFDQSVRQRALQNDSFIDYQKQQTILAERFTLFSLCINWTAIDIDYDTVSEFGFTFDSLVNQEQCKILFEPINVSDALLHNCAAVQDCESACGITDNIMRQQTHETSCTVEWGLHSYFLSALFATAIYICVNISRFYFMRAVIAIWWKQITLNLFSYLGSCTKSGTIIPPKRVKNGEVTFQELTQEKLDIVLRRFSRGGYFELVYAILINAPWVIFISIISQDLKYDSE